LNYREPTEALRAQLEQAEGELRESKLAATNLQQKLSRAESALAAYRTSSPESAPRTEFAAWVVIVICVVSWLASLLAVMQDHDGLGTHLAAAAAGVALFSPLIVHASAGHLLFGGVGLGVRLTFALVATSSATARMASSTDSWQVLFWAGPLTLAVGSVVECTLLIRHARGH
jgi:hypothetical protein